MNPAPPVTRYEAIVPISLPSAQLSNADATAARGTRLPTKPGLTFAELSTMLFVIVAAIVVCSLIGWLILHLGIEVIQALVALALMTITWHFLRRRPYMTIADEFKYW